MFTAQHRYVSVIGSAYNAAEHWQFGFRLDAGPGTNDAIAFDIGQIMKAWWTNAAPFDALTGAGAYSTHNLTEIKVATINPDGHYPPGTIASSYFVVPELAGPAGPIAAAIPQATVVATLTTNIPRGYASKGRMYLPLSTRGNIDVDGRMPVANAQRVLNGVKLMINQINALPSVGSVAIFSRGKAERGPAKPNGQPTYTYPNPGASAIVTGVRVGRVVDTQRRRRRSLAEQPEAALL